MTGPIITLDPVLGNTAALAANVNWMNGVQFFLNTNVPISPGYIIYININWALTSMSQVQFWDSTIYNIDAATTRLVKGILSVE